MGSSSVNDINTLENILHSNSENRINEFIKAKILSKKQIDNTQFSKLSLFICNVRCEQFVIKTKEIAEFIHNIHIKIKDIKLKMIHNFYYLEITKYTILNEELPYPGDSQVPIHTFKFPKKIDKLDLADYSRDYVSIKLKVKETDLITYFNYEFLDLYNNKVEIDSLNNYPEETFERENIYLFHGFYYKENILYKANFSTIEICDGNSISENIYFTEDISKINNGDIVNLKGFIKDLIIEEMTILLEEESSHSQIKIKLNYELTKKINPNSECKFINIKKISDEVFGLTPLSDVYSNNETTIQLKVKDVQDQYYDRINIGRDYVDIENNIHGDMLKFNINSKDKNFLFEQKFTFEKTSKKIDKNNKEIIIVEDSYGFNLEVNKWKINSFSCFLKCQGGYTYQLNFQTKDQNFLPEIVKIKLPNNQNMEIDEYETFDNNLKRRFTIINAVKQDFVKLNYQESSLSLNESEFKDIDNIKNLKILYLVKNKEINKIFETSIINNKSDSEVFLFKLSGGEEEKKICDVNENDRTIINNFFEHISNKKFQIDDEEKNKISLFLESKDFKNFFSQGFNEYIFHDTKREYNLMKKLLILYFLITFDDENIQFFLIRLKNIFKYLNKVDYLTRIKVFIYYYQYYEQINLINCKIIDIYDEENNEFLQFRPIFDSFKLFFKILDNQKEKCLFYQAIHQFNGIIREELISNIKMYSGSIISLKDIKFELVKKISRFFFVDIKTITTNNAFYSPFCHLVTFNLISFMDKIDLTLSKRISAVFLFLIFHKVCGHLKTNINNQTINDSPEHNLDENLNLIYTKFSESESGFIFENILTKNIINYRLMISEPKAEDLFKLKLYIQDNFNDLQKKIEEISPTINTNDEQYENKELPQSLIDKLNEVRKNLDQYNYHSLFPLFIIPDGMTKAKFKELLKDNPVYKRFQECCPKNGDKY